MSKPDPKEGTESSENLKNTVPELDRVNEDEESTEIIWDDDWHPDSAI